eukprot:Phypoly_transcript_09154.p1 GENE.Phypoly_transcript_09154~~Phypoly_transcript_09154.p1  ORF type:complete len:139 (-),score=18.08 Phypoly_transcript_09154:388-804(-)
MYLLALFLALLASAFASSSPNATILGSCGNYGGGSYILTADVLATTFLCVNITMGANESLLINGQGYKFYTPPKGYQSSITIKISGNGEGSIDIRNLGVFAGWTGVQISNAGSLYFDGQECKYQTRALCTSSTTRSQS